MKLWLLLFSLPLTLSAQETPPAPPRTPPPAYTKNQATSAPKIESVKTAPKKEEPRAEDKSTWEKIKEKSSDAMEKTSEQAGEVQQALAKRSKFAEYRAERNWLLTGNYSYVDFVVPSKYGLSVGYVADASTTYELNYMRSSWGLGWIGINGFSVTEQRLAALYRHYGERGTFNQQFGIHYNQFDIAVGDWLLSKISGTKSDYHLMQIQTLGLSYGLGNRWQSKGGFVWAVDWFQIHVPVTTLRQHTPYIDATTDDDDRDDAKTAIRWIRHFPRIVALQFQLGFSF